MFAKLVVLLLRTTYFFIKLLPIRDKVVLISRFSDSKTLDFSLLEDEIGIQYPDFKIVILTQKLQGQKSFDLKYILFMLKKMYHLATSRVCIVDSYVMTVSVLKHKKELLIIQIWHALGAIKQFGYQVLDKPDGYPRELAYTMHMHENYDYIISSGSETSKHYAKAFNTDIEKILPIGMPRIDYLREQKDIKNDLLVREHPQVKGKKNIVYVPTFRKNRDLEIDGLISSVDYDNYNLILKPHPNETIDVEDDRVILDYEFPSMDWMKYADFVITDYSAVAFEAMILDKPLFFYLFDYEQYKKETGLNIDWFKDIPEYTSESAKEIINRIQTKKYNMNIYNSLRDKYLSAIKNNCTEEIVKLFKFKNPV